MHSATSGTTWRRATVRGCVARLLCWESENEEDGGVVRPGDHVRRIFPK